MRTRLTHTSNATFSDVSSTMKKFFWRKKPSKPSPEPAPPISVASPGARYHGIRGTIPPSHAPPNASGYVNSHPLHGGVSGSLYAIPARTTAHVDSGTHAVDYGERPSATTRQLVNSHPLHGGTAGSLFSAPARTTSNVGSGTHAARDYGGFNTTEHEYSTYGSQPANHTNNSMCASRSELLGGARQRDEEEHAAPQDLASPAHGAYGPEATSANDTSYNSDRQLTAEEEEEDVEAVKSQIHFTKHQTVTSTETALRAITQAEETGHTTLARLGTQGESLQNTQRNLELASSHNKVAAEKTRELEKANGSMFAIYINNPIGSTVRAEAEEAKILAIHQEERAGRAELRADDYESRSKIGKALSDTSGIVESQAKFSLAEHSRYQFEPDESDDEMEWQIGENLEDLVGTTARLKALAFAMSDEVGNHIDLKRAIFVESEDQIIVNSDRIR